MDRKRHSDPTYLLFPKDLHRFRTQNEITNNTARPDGFSMGSPLHPTETRRGPSSRSSRITASHRAPRKPAETFRPYEVEQPPVLPTDADALVSMTQNV
jgi:hypothetical protein